MILLRGIITLDSNTSESGTCLRAVHQVTCTALYYESSFPLQILRRAAFTDDELAKHFCEASFEVLRPRLQRGCMLGYLCEFIQLFPPIALTRSPKGTLLQAVCYICQYEVCSGGRQLDGRFPRDDINDRQGLTDVQLQTALSLIW